MSDLSDRNHYMKDAAVLTSVTVAVFIIKTHYPSGRTWANIFGSSVHASVVQDEEGYVLFLSQKFFKQLHISLGFFSRVSVLHVFNILLYQSCIRDKYFLTHFSQK